jgi:hypothetical protein
VELKVRGKQLSHLDDELQATMKQVDDMRSDLSNEMFALRRHLEALNAPTSISAPSPMNAAQIEPALNTAQPASRQAEHRRLEKQRLAIPAHVAPRDILLQ